MGRFEPRAVSPKEHASGALETLADVIRSVGEHAFDTHREPGQLVRERAEQWAKHLLLGAAHPLGQVAAGRDFSGALQFIRELRMREAEFVHTTLGDLRALVRVVFASIERALLADRESDQQMQRQIERLQHALRESGIEALRAEVLRVTAELTAALSSRELRRGEALKNIGSELGALNKHSH